MPKENRIIDYLLIVIAFIFGGTGLGILFNANNGNLISVIGGFVLIGIAVTAIYKVINE